jgi:hypothetical protein
VPRRRLLPLQPGPAKAVYGCATATMYGIKEYAAVLNGVMYRYGINARFNHELVEIHLA